MKALKIALVYVLVAGTVSALAIPSAWKQFAATYDIKEGSNLFKAKCTVCHTTMKSKLLNAYGKDIETLLKPTGSKKVTEKMLREVEGKDSGHKGGTNLSRIHADKLP